MKEEQNLYKGTISTPIGELTALATAGSLVLLEYADRYTSAREMNAIASSLNAVITDKENSIIQGARSELERYFLGELKTFATPLMLIGSDFQIKVWNRLLAIPFGELHTYQQQAMAVADAKAVRAVAGANGSNHLAIIVPCHRIIGTGGKLTGYSGGLWRKKWLIEHELNHSALQRGTLF